MNDEPSISNSNKIAFIKWNLEDPYTLEDFNRSMKADSLCAVIYDFQRYMRNLEKYDATPEERPVVDRIRDKFYSLLEEHDINIDKIYS